jgi:hypothetical protein
MLLAAVALRFACTHSQAANATSSQRSATCTAALLRDIVSRYLKHMHEQQWRVVHIRAAWSRSFIVDACEFGFGFCIAPRSFGTCTMNTSTLVANAQAAVDSFLVGCLNSTASGLRVSRNQPRCCFINYASKAQHSSKQPTAGSLGLLKKSQCILTVALASRCDSLAGTTENSNTGAQTSTKFWCAVDLCYPCFAPLATAVEHAGSHPVLERGEHIGTAALPAARLASKHKSFGKWSAPPGSLDTLACSCCRMGKGGNPFVAVVKLLVE